MTENKRKHDRINSLNLSYVLIDENDEVINQAMGRTLNVSESGILLETHFYIDKKQNVLLSIGLEDELVDIKGEVIYSRASENKKYETGINFLEIDETARLILKMYIKAFKSRMQE